jgi:hypothetical protein
LRSFCARRESPDHAARPKAMDEKKPLGVDERFFKEPRAQF